MTDYISRADAIGAVHEYYQKRFTEDSKWDADAKMFVLEDKTIAKDNMEICNIIKALPSADAVQGEWIEVEDYNGDVHYKCDQCGEEWTFPFGTPKENNANYCPSCGAKMKGGAE